MSGLALLAAAVAAQPCDLPPGWAAIAARHSRYIIFGETHGTDQAPAFVGQVACALAKRRERLLIAIEQDSSANAAFQPVWASPDAGFPEALRQFPEWKGRLDGVASQAMFAMLVRLHGLRTVASLIDVVLFNGAKDDAQRALHANLPGQGSHEAAQAENIRTAAARASYSHVLVLTGNVHARKGPARFAGVNFSPMAMQLAPARETVSLRLVSGAGTEWNCVLNHGTTLKPGQPVTSAMIDCGNHVVQAMATFDRPPFVALAQPPGVMPDEVYDGYAWLGPITGSPPAVPGDKP